MRKIVERVLFCFFLFFGSVSLVSAQVTSKIEILEMGGFVDKESLYMLDSRFSISRGKAEEMAQKGNNIFIQQIGNNNHIDSSISSQESDLDLFQSGNDNFIAIETVVKSIDGTVLQNGDNNFSFTSAHDPNFDLFLDVDMIGNGHHFENHGTNSIGNKLQFNITGDSKTIIVRNFK